MGNLKRTIFILCMYILCSVMVYAQIEEVGYTDIPSPKVHITVYPENGGKADYYYSEETQEFQFFAESSLGYRFVSWTIDDKVISDRIYMSIPYVNDEEIYIMANFSYDDSLPKINLDVEPHNGGTIEYHYSETEHEIYFWVNPSPDYKLISWTNNGTVISYNPDVKIPYNSGGEDINLLATLKYDPKSPEDPGGNYFNKATGELIIDNFNPGSLYETICKVVPPEDFEYISSCIIAGQIGYYELTFFHLFSNCTVIDLGRTYGYSEITSEAFASSTVLTELIFPSCVNYIGSDAFDKCDNLSIITCYATIPPSFGEDVFNDLDKSVIIKVPESSINLYKNAAGWKDFTILPADENVFSISVALPEDAKDGRYKNMSIELLNTSNGQRYKYLITDKTEYVFGNLLSDTKYSVFVKNSKNEILGEIKDLEVVDKNLTASFQSLLQPLNLSLQVLTPDGKNITNDVVVKWFNESNELLHQGSSLTGVLENTVVSYAISLPQELQTVYLQPSPKTLTASQSSPITCTLESLGKTILSGRIIDKDGQTISTAIITISQNINGTYTNSKNVSCDNDGNFNIEIPNVPIKVTVSANGYIGQTKELLSASAGFGEIVLEKNVGITIFPSYTFRESVSAGETKPETDWYSNDANIAYRISDINGNEIPNCIYQAGAILLPETIELEDNVIVTVFSKDNRFKEVSQSVSVTSKSINVKLPIVEYGGISVKSSDTQNAMNTCILYDATGKQIGKISLRNNEISFTNLPDGEYLLITMRQSSLLGSIQNLSSLRETPLQEGKDYIINKVNVISGRIADVTIANVPDLDETKLYYTNSKETYFMPNKSLLTIGNYVTLKAKLTIKDEYAADINAATLIVDIPSNCEFVENSIISGSGYLGYEYANNRLSIPIQNLNDAVRFCIVPLEGGDCKPSAFIKMVIDNEEILQPIGSAYFEAKSFSLAAPSKTSKADIAVRGTAIPDSEVLIYDNGNLVGSTYSMPNGQWAVRLSLHKPYSRSIHYLYGEVITKDGKRLLTQTKVVDYDQSYVDLSKVTMVYNNTNIIFDQLNGKNTTNSYSYVPGTTDFTFIADFTENNPEKISNVVVKILASDGSVRLIPAEYNSTSGNWVVQTKYANSDVLPINATAEYILITKSSKFDIDMHKEHMSMSNENLENTISILSKGKVEVLLDQEHTKQVAITPEGRDEAEFISAEILNYDQVKEESERYRKVSVVDGEKNFCYRDTIANNVYTFYYLDNIKKEAYSLSYYGNNPISQNKSRIVPIVISALWGVISAGIERELRQGTIEFWRRTYESDKKSASKLYKDLYKVLYAKCKDGSFKIKDSSKFDKDNQLVNNWINNYEDFLVEYNDAIDYLASYYVKKFYALSTFGIVSSITLGGLGSFANMFQTEVKPLVSAGITGGLEAFGQALGYKVNNDFKDGPNNNLLPEEILSDWVVNHFKNFTAQYKEVVDQIKADYSNCKKNDEDDDKKSDEDVFPTPPITPSIDPSGYVYEAVPSNRIHGVTATAYYKQQSEDMYGDITETVVLWDAAPFGQENPLTTDAQGKYAWDVPAGMWQVRFEKEGYEPAQSAWLPVPPPQLDVNIAMTQAKQPEVKTVHAYSDGVTIEFDKFMLPSTLTVGNVAITQNGNFVNGTIESSDMELDANGNAFCSKIEFKPESPLADGEATLFVSKAVKSYANINMNEDFMQTFTVEPRVSEIKVEKNIEVSSGSTMTVSASIVSASAAKGKTVLIESLNPMLATVSAEKVEPNANGMVSFDVAGLILGSTSIKLSVEDYDVEAVIDVNIVEPRDENQVATPYASVKSGEIQEGTEIYLYCDTDNASIYYTLDGSCPCDMNRLKYDGTPIIASKDFTLKVLAEAEGMLDSEIAEYQYTVDSSSIEDLYNDQALSINPLPLGEYLNISNGDYLIDSASIFDLSGTLKLRSSKPEKQVTLKVGSLSQGLYLLNVKTNGQTTVKKVIKR